MITLRKSSAEEYAGWYLDREAKKRDPSSHIPIVGTQAIETMHEHHAGKMRPWFNERTAWSIILIANQIEIERLIFLESDWTKSEGLVVPQNENYRLLGRVARRAADVNYLASAKAHRHREYYESLKAGTLKLQNESRIAICSPEQSELRLNPQGTFYLLDGVGRGLPYVMLLQSGMSSFTPVEAFLAEKI